MKDIISRSTVGLVFPSLITLTTNIKLGSRGPRKHPKPIQQYTVYFTVLPNAYANCTRTIRLFITAYITIRYIDSSSMGRERI